MFLFSFNKLYIQKYQLEQKHLHLLQILESERTAKWQYTQQCEELVAEIKKLRTEVRVGIIFTLITSRCCSNIDFEINEISTNSHIDFYWFGNFN